VPERFVPQTVAAAQPGLTRAATRCNVNINVLRLLTFGGLGLVHDDGSAAPRLRPPRLALLAALAAAGERGVSRERLMSFFWPDSDEGHGRHSLRQALYALRQDLGLDVVRSDGASLALDDACIGSDVADFHRALAADDRVGAVTLARGRFLDGFYLPTAPEFERWVEDERTRLTTELSGALTTLAAESAEEGDLDAAVEWWRQLTIIEPLSGRFAAGYMATLASRGDRATALVFVRQHETLVRRELDAEPDPEVRRVEARLRATPHVEGGAGSIGARPGSSPTATTPSAPVRTAGPTALGGPNVPGATRRKFVHRGAWIAGTAGLIALAATTALARQRGWLRLPDTGPTLAVGIIREDGVPDSLRMGRVLTDMLATNLGRVEGISVLANSRLLELMRPGQDSVAGGYIDAARRAGAESLLEGQVLATRDRQLVLEIREVDLRTGIVRRAYRVNGADRYALVDSMTRTITENRELASPRSSVAEATTSSPIAYRLYEEGLRAYTRVEHQTAQRLMYAALQEDSTFAMAAYYEAKLAIARPLPDGRNGTQLRARALRLAERAPDRERLMIRADLLHEEQDPRAIVVAESLITKFPNDPRALAAFARVRFVTGDWGGAVRATERAIALDSAAASADLAMCRVCEDFSQLADVYFWWDSLPAVVRVARRFLRAYPNAFQPQYQMALAGARRGDSTAAYTAFRRLSAIAGVDRGLKLRLDLNLEAYDVVEHDVQSFLASSFIDELNYGAWMYLIALRNQGRLREAVLLHATGWLPPLPKPAIRGGRDGYNDGILAFERGHARAAADAFGRLARRDVSHWPPSVQARDRAWNSTLQGMALAALGDTAEVRGLADTVERWGRGSVFGRDRLTHHYLRGLVLAAAGRHEDAVRQYRQAIYSPSLGFTRVNYELGRSLMALGRPVEAVAALQPALRGEVDAANLYVTRTDLHEVLAQAFAAAGVRDSAAFHYRAVVKAWDRADPAFHARRAAARDWLARNPR